MFEVVEVNRGWWTKTVKLRATEDIKFTVHSADGKHDVYSYKKDETMTAKFPLRDIVKKGDMIAEQTLVRLHSLIPSRFDIV